MWCNVPAAALPSHTVVVNSWDLSVWCYGCDTFLDFFHIPVRFVFVLCTVATRADCRWLEQELHPLVNAVHVLKFGEPAKLPSSCPTAASPATATPPAGAAAPPAAAPPGAAAPPPAPSAPVTELAARVAAASPRVRTFVNRVKGLVYGNAIGDAVGLATEFMDAATVRGVYGDLFDRHAFEYKDVYKDGHRRRWTTGDWTDDTDQLLLIIRNVLQSPELKPTAGVFGAQLLQWGRQGFPELGDTGGLGIGFTVHSVLRHDLFSKSPHHAADLVWKSSGCYLAANGAVMRTSVLAVPHFHDPDAVEADTLEMALATHADPRSTAACVAVTHALAMMLRGETMDSAALTAAAVDRGAKFITALDPALATRPGSYNQADAMQDFAKHLNALSFEDLHLDEADKIGYALKCAGSAFVALRDDRPFRDVMCDLVKQAGDADTNGAVAGALLGCRLGYDALPESWLHGMPNKAFLDDLVAKLLLRVLDAMPADYV